MVRLHRAGVSIREIARRLNRDKKTVKKWIQRAADTRLDRVDFSDQRANQKQAANRLDPLVEARIIETRKFLKEQSDLGEFGAKAIHQVLMDDEISCVPCVRTIGNVLRRNGLLGENRRRRFSPPPPVWYLPEVRDFAAEMDCFDYIEDLKIRGSEGVLQVMNVISQHGSLTNSWVGPVMRSGLTTQRILEHWKRFGRPAYVQFDNGTVFAGPPHPLVLGMVPRMCLELGTQVVFTIPRETGPQAKIERFNHTWEKSIWNRFSFANEVDLERQIAKFLEAHRRKHAAAISEAPERFPVPADWKPSFPSRVQGRVIFIRRTDEKGQVFFLGQTFLVASTWPHRLVRCNVDFTNQRIEFYRLRRREPLDQPLMKTLEFEFPSRIFRPQTE